MSALTDYRTSMVQIFWKYQNSCFGEQPELFERPFALDGRPPVFLRSEAWRNVIIKPDGSDQERDRLLAKVPTGERHKWFGSMSSSQALAQSIFGNLAVYGHLECLARIEADEGMPLFGGATITSQNFEMEHKVTHLEEPRSTRLDGYYSGDYQVAIECKFTEAEVGTCSRPRLRSNAPNYVSEYCNGTYTKQKGRTKRCSLAEIGVSYWDYVPNLFRWGNDTNLSPCPLNKNYQLIRNILAVGVTPEKVVSLHTGHAVLIYDNRNPAFQEGGQGLAAYKETRVALHEPDILRKCSWQRIAKQIRSDGILPWLTECLEQKYGL
jgi:hypothetical protein